MAVVALPVTPGAPFQRFQVELDKVVYGFDLRWNHRAQLWSMTLLDAAGTILAASICLRFGTLLLPAVRPLSFPPGALLLVDAAANTGELTLENLGVQIEIVYFDSAETAAVLAG